MPHAGGTFAPKPVPKHDLLRRVRTDRKVVAYIAVAVIALGLACGWIGYRIGHQDGGSVTVDQATFGTVVFVGNEGHAGCVRTDAGKRLCSQFALPGQFTVKTGDRVGIAHEWAKAPSGNGSDLLLLYPPNGD